MKRRSQAGRLRAVAFGLVLVAVLAACRNGERLRDVATDAPLVGRSVPALVVTDLERQPVDLAALRGRNILLNLWATWCIPCREEMPELEELQAKYDPEDLSVVGLSIDDIDPALVVAFLEANQITYTNLLTDGPSVIETLGVSPGIPHTLLIDREGVVRGYWRGRFRPFEPDAAALLRSVVAQ